jgi:transposase InsO family protein
MGEVGRHVPAQQEVAVPWRIPDVMTIRLEFVAEALGRRRTVAALCEAYGISEKCGYKWLRRFREHGPAGLADASHAPHGCPHRTPAAQRDLLTEARRAHPTWGARKLRAHLAAAHPALRWPAASTITELLDAEGLIAPRRRRAAGGGGAGGACASAAEPNALWTMDYKGHFRTRDGRWCYPLTVVDTATRYLLACAAHAAPETGAARAVLRRCFRAYGLPAALQSDNGPPFGAAHAPRGFSRLSLWLCALGVAPRFGAPGHPEHNGRHERLHRTLKAEATRPPAATLRAQQARFDAFRAEYNGVRPHEALGQVPPGHLYRPSPRPLVEPPPAPAYPTHYHERRVTPAGLIWWHHRGIYVSQALAGYTVGLAPVSADRWDVYFTHYLLGTADLTTLRFTRLTQGLASPINPV